MLSKDRSTFAPFAGVAELADARDLKSRATKVAYRFDPGHRHQLFKYRGVEQLVARRAHNPEAAGSSPVPATISSGCNWFQLHPLLLIYSRKEFADMSDLLGLLIECYNKNDFLPLRPYLSDDCKYTSQWVFDEMVGGNRICDYLITKSKRISEAGSIVIAKRATILNPYFGREAALMFQDDKESPSCIILIKTEKEHITQIDICMPELFEFK